MKNDYSERGAWTRRDVVKVGGLATVAGVIGRASEESVLAAAPIDPSFDLFGLEGKAAAEPLALGQQI